MMSDNWSDAKKFKYETLRNIVFIITGLMGTSVVIEPWRDSSEHFIFLQRENIRYKQVVVNDFFNDSYFYYSSINEVLLSDGMVSKQDVDKYELHYDKYRNSLNKIINIFDMREQSKYLILLDEADDIRYKLRKMYKNELKKDGFKGLRYRFKVINNRIANMALASIGLKIPVKIQ